MASTFISNLLVKNWLLLFLEEVATDQYSKILVEKGYLTTKDLKDEPPSKEDMLRYGLPDNKNLNLFMKELSILCQSSKGKSCSMTSISFVTLLTSLVPLISYGQNIDR